MDRQNLTYGRLKELLTQRFALQYDYMMLHEARQEKVETLAQFLDRLRTISAKTIRKGSTPTEITILTEEG
jgi:hypothetical protein